MQAKQRYFDNLEVDMTSYPNILTPPMDSPEFAMFSPGSEGSSRSPPLHSALNIYDEVPSPDYLNHGSEPFLEITENPVDKFRFRYKSEMAGTHGSLNGHSSDRSRKQTFPCVRLRNYSKPAIVRCSLYQIGRREPHAHRLVKRMGPEEKDDPHDIEVDSDRGYNALFMSMGIIHTAKKFIVGELSRKYDVLKSESIVRQEGYPRPLTELEEIEIKQKAESESNHINLNQVCLKFEAFSKRGDALFPICSPKYSGTINNLKSAQTGDLKIVRMDHCTSPSRGGREIFILVEKVTKKNIKVRFFEVDDEENEIWCDYGRFSDLDVHHQYAIVFKTPAYRTIDIDRPAKVYIELQRPSDGARSEAKDFTYTPCEIMQNRKRARAAAYNSYSSSLDFSSKELPAILPTLDFTVNSTELEEALHKDNINSGEFNKICEQLIGTNSLFELYAQDESPNYAMDTSSARSNRKNAAYNEDMIIRIAASEMENFFSSIRTFSGNNKKRVQLMLESILEEPKYKLENGNGILHILVLKNNYKHEFLRKLLQLLDKYELPSGISTPNKSGATPLHLAVALGNASLVGLLLEVNADLSFQDLGGNTPLHTAIMKNVGKPVLESIFEFKTTSQFINLKNNEGNTALHLAIKTNNITAVEILCKHNADVNLQAGTNGYTPLHMAVADQHNSIVKFLLDYKCDTTRVDFSGSNALKLAMVLVEPEKPIAFDVYRMLENHMKDHGTFDYGCLKEEDTRDDSSSDMDLDIIKNEPAQETPTDPFIVKYSRMTHLPDECTQKIGKILNPNDEWKKLAERLNYGHCVRGGFFANDKDPTKSFIDYILASGENMLHLRRALSDMGQEEVVAILDDLVKREEDI